MHRKRIYIAGPITRGNLSDNVNRATEAFIVLSKAGFAPFCPHWSVYSKPCRPVGGLEYECSCVGTRDGNDSMTYNDWIGICLAWVAVSDGVLRLPGTSKGADLEVTEAERLEIPVFHEVDEVIRYYQHELEKDSSNAQD